MEEEFKDTSFISKCNSFSLPYSWNNQQSLTYDMKDISLVSFITSWLSRCDL